MPKNRQRITWIICSAIFLWMFLVVTSAQLRMAPTFDEQNHVTRGISVLRTGDYRLCYHQPPLANIMEGVPLIWQHTGFTTNLSAWKDARKRPENIWPVSTTTIWSNMRQGLQLIHWARLPILLFTLIMAGVVFLWSRELFGLWGGLLSLLLLAFDPNILAHSGLATTDIAAAATIALALYLLRRHLLHPTRWTLLAAGVGLGLALGAKFSSIIIFPIMALLLFIFTIVPISLEKSLLSTWINLPWITRFRHALWVGVLIIIVGCITLWGIYGFHIETLGKRPGAAIGTKARLIEQIPIPALQYFRGIKAVASEAKGHPAFLLNQIDTTGHGWWYYFPVAIATKTPLPELILILSAFAIIIIPQLRRQLQIPWYEWSFLVIPIIIYLMAASGLFGFSLNLGIRHILPVFPFLLILPAALVRLAQPVVQKKTCLWLLPAVGVFLVLQIIDIAHAFPYYLSYFNTAAEMWRPGYTILVDSNMDWGQDLPQLALLQRQKRLYPLFFSYFGTTPPAAYGISATPLAGFGIMEKAPAPDFATLKGYLAISVTDLMEGKAYTGFDYRMLQRMKPSYLAGKTIVIYDFRERAPVSSTTPPHN